MTIIVHRWLDAKAQATFEQCLAEVEEIDAHYIALADKVPMGPMYVRRLCDLKQRCIAEREPWMKLAKDCLTRRVPVTVLSRAS